MSAKSLLRYRGGVGGLGGGGIVDGLASAVLPHLPQEQHQQHHLLQQPQTHHHQQLTINTTNNYGTY